MIRNTRLGRFTRRHIRRGLRWVGSAYARQLRLRACKAASAPARALGWIRRHESPGGGIFVDSSYREGYPEVTGYLVPTLLQYGERELATRLVRWLVSIQRGDGAFTDPNEGLPNVFDTGQVLRGLLAGTEIVPQAVDAARRAADYLCAQMRDGGRGGFGPRYQNGRYQGEIPETIHLYALPPLCHAATVFQDERYRTAAELCCAHYATHADALNLGTLTHYLAYELEALIDLGHADMAAPVLEKLRVEQRPDGAVPGTDGVQWVCAPGLAQLAVCWYKLGLPEPADRAVSWLEAHQELSGGFLGGYGEHAWYFPDREPSWAAKFFLDAHALRAVSYFNREAATAAPSITRDDGRVKAVLSVLGPNDDVVEVGCGAGHVLKAVREARPGSTYTGVDISDALLARVPADVRTLRGSLEAIPCAEDRFDVAFSVETIEYSANMQAAVEELVRVTRPGGWVVIVYKTRAHSGQPSGASWTREPPAGWMSRWLRRGCDHVTTEPVPHEDRLQPGALVVWKGQKRSPQSGESEPAVLTPAENADAIVHNVRYNRVSEWGQAVLVATSPGEKVLALGKSTVEVSLQLARAGRHVTLVDSKDESLSGARDCAHALDLSIATVQADATRALGFGSDEFDCVWSCGLLERCGADERRAALREWARVAAKMVMTLVPNGACVAYQAGKAHQEESGTWSSGLEIPLLSLREEYEAAGLRVVSEYSVGARHALSFLPSGHPLRSALSSWMASVPWDAARRYHQGHLLVTIGVKRLPARR
jgi:malonyl-CoA O-methyltransferase